MLTEFDPYAKFMLVVAGAAVALMIGGAISIFIFEQFNRKKR